MPTPKDYVGPPLIEHMDAHHGHPFTAEQRRAAATRGQAKAERHKTDGLSYEEITTERRNEYRERIRTLSAEDRATLDDFASRLSAKSGTSVVKKEHCALGWRAAFMVQRYGEEVEHWPTALTAADKKRAAQMIRGSSKELGEITPLQFVNGILQLPGGTVLYGLNDVQPED
jgi:hypothetical protein